MQLQFVTSNMLRNNIVQLDEDREQSFDRDDRPLVILDDDNERYNIRCVCRAWLAQKFTDLSARTK